MVGKTRSWTWCAVLCWVLWGGVHCAPPETTQEPNEFAQETNPRDASSADQPRIVCSTDPDCPDPARPFCYRNQCVLFCRPQGCLEDRDCGENRRCVQGACEDRPPCRCSADGDCVAPAVCVQCQCVKSPACRTNKECTEPGAPRCEAGSCVKAECTRDQDCAKTPARPSCVGLRCSQKICAKDDDCAGTKTPACRDGVCRPAFCKSDDDCKDPAPLCRAGRCLRVDCVKGG